MGDFFWDWAAVGGDAGVVDYDVGDAPFLLDGFAEVGYLGGVGDVAGEGCGGAAFAARFFVLRLLVFLWCGPLGLLLRRLALGFRRRLRLGRRRRR